MVIDGVEVIGIDDEFPDYLEYFQEELVCNTLYKPAESPSIHKIVSLSVDTSIVSSKVLDAPDRGLSNSKNYLNRRVFVEVNLYFRLKYTKNTTQQYIYTMNEEVTKVFYMSMPKYLDNTPIEDLLRHNKINITSYIADIYAKEKDENSIYTRVLLFISANLKNRYKIYQ
ncbi:hypothetical protein [Romboutsia sp.]|uniref:hypothetical protein n=1 Tax=Romboutsia sp. TaxID=1965302 RepID=UPI003F3DE238